MKKLDQEVRPLSEHEIMGITEDEFMALQLGTNPKKESSEENLEENAIIGTSEFLRIS